VSVAGEPGAAASAASQRFDELERVVRHLGEELAFFRRRALDAERRARELAAHPSVAGSAALSAPATASSDTTLQARLEAAEAENADLRERLREAAERTRALADRVRFVRQQAAPDDEEAA
jgi:prefoldin subunit 5